MTVTLLSDGIGRRCESKPRAELFDRRLDADSSLLEWIEVSQRRRTQGK
jgi:hypothetical protein